MNACSTLILCSRCEQQRRLFLLSAQPLKDPFSVYKPDDYFFNGIIFFFFDNDSACGNLDDLSALPCRNPGLDYAGLPVRILYNCPLILT